MNKVVHFEIPMDDVERAQKFYSAVFDWQIQPIPEMKYTIVRTGPIDEQQMPKESGFINGGMFKRSGPVKSPVITIAVESLDDAFKKIEQAGGKIQKDNKGEAKMKVGDMGWAAYFIDTEGNILGLWQNAK